MNIVGFDKTILNRITCKHCGAIIEFYRNEVLTAEYNDSEYTGYPYMYILCPNCNNKLIINMRDLK